MTLIVARMQVGHQVVNAGEPLTLSGLKLGDGRAGGGVRRPGDGVGVALGQQLIEAAFAPVSDRIGLGHRGESFGVGPGDHLVNSRFRGLFHHQSLGQIAGKGRGNFRLPHYCNKNEPEARNQRNGLARWFGIALTQSSMPGRNICVGISAVFLSASVST